jgi:ELWxxDGT repeat protein
MNRQRSLKWFLALIVTLVTGVAPGKADATSPSAGGFVQLGDRLIFSTLGVGADGVLWSTDGTAAGTLALTSRICPSPCQDVRPLGTVGDVALFAASSGRLWRTDGTPAGTSPVSGPFDSIGETAMIDPRDGVLFFTACNEQSGCELWSSDGTRAGTRIVKDIVPGAVGSDPRALTPWRGRLYFLAGGESLSDTGLWTTDGTAVGTRFVAPSVNNFTNGETVLAATPIHLLFTSLDVTEQLWASNGTPRGTRLLRRFAPPSCTEPDLCQGPYISYIEPVAGPSEALFIASDGVHGPQIWETGGEHPDTVALTAVGGGILGSASILLRPGRLWIFSAPPSPKAPPVLWSADFYFEHPAPLTGCIGGCPEVFFFFPLPVSVTPPQRLLFVGKDPAHGAELWVTDGTAPGTRRLSDVCPGPCSAFSENVPPTVLGNVAGRVYFLATPTADGDSPDFWVTDRTPAGTRRISGFTRGVGILDGLVYYGVADASGLELWVTDGTVAGSHPVTVLLPAPAG